VIAVLETLAAGPNWDWGRQKAFELSLGVK
jgi:hypothetical protein